MTTGQIPMNSRVLFAEHGVFILGRIVAQLLTGTPRRLIIKVRSDNGCLWAFGCSVPVTRVDLKDGSLAYVIDPDKVLDTAVEQYTEYALLVCGLD